MKSLSEHHVSLLFKGRKNLQSQFIQKGFKKAENSEQNITVVFIYNRCGSIGGGGGRERKEDQSTMMFLRRRSVAVWTTKKPANNKTEFKVN